MEQTETIENLDYPIDRNNIKPNKRDSAWNGPR